MELRKTKRKKEKTEGRETRREERRGTKKKMVNMLSHVFLDWYLNQVCYTMPDKHPDSMV